MSGRIDFELAFGGSKARIKTGGDSCYRIYVLGNFSGRREGTRGLHKITAIDIDNFDQVMARIKPTLEIKDDVSLSFENLDDFHPDIWLRKIPILADLLELKRQLSNPTTAEQAAAKIKAFLPGTAQNDSPAPLQETSETDEQTLERLLGKRPESPVVKSNTVDKLIQDMVSPYISKAVQSQHSMFTDIIDATISQYLRILLHRPDFQGLESLWRTMADMVNEEGSDQHRFFLVDTNQGELLHALQDEAKEFEQKLLTHIEKADNEQDVLLLGDFQFCDKADDAELLGLCSRLAKEANGLFLSAGSQFLVESALDDVQRWEHICRQIACERIMLAYPRYLLRLPYGQKTESLEALAFEECADVPLNDELLWGNSAFLLARVLMRHAQQVREDSFFFENVPCFAVDKDGEQVLQPAVETIMTENKANAVLATGIMPVIAYHQRQGVRLLALSTLCR